MKKFILYISMIIFVFHIKAQEEREYQVSPKAYGVTFDGTYLYYLDSERRALIRFDSIGGEEIFNIGLAGMKGISFDSKEGRLLVTAPRFILKLDPNTGGVIERIPIPLDNIAGIASADGLYYLLDLTDGKVHFYDKASRMIVGGFHSDRSAPKDLSYGKDSIWISDSSNGIVYRYNPNDGKITGSVQSPAGDIRGVLFSGSRLWVVDRASKQIKAVPFVETQRFLASGESNYNITYKLTYSLPNTSLSNAELGILLPPSNEHQRVRNISSKDKSLKNGVLFKTRGLIKKFNLDSQRGEQETEISFQVRLSNMTYFVDDRFLNKKESIPDELNAFRDPSKENYQLSPRDTLSIFNQSFREGNSVKIRHSLLKNGFPVLTGKKIIYKEGSRSADITDYLSSFLPGFGWIPYSPSSIPDSDNNRLFEYSDKEIVLFQSLDSDFLPSPIFFRSTSAEEWKNISTKWSLSIRKIKNQ